MTTFISPKPKTPTTLITGFLGAGKTTLINHLLSLKAHSGKWALLVNEFGKIGIDDSLVSSDQELAIKQISGGCICCSSVLPLQVALVRLINDHQPEHLLIEPTGLAHPSELTDLLTQPQWQSSLELRATLCVLNIAQWQQDKYRQHDQYLAHIRAADVVIYHHQHLLTSTDELLDWIGGINQQAQVLSFQALDTILVQDLINLPKKSPQNRLIISLPTAAAPKPAPENPPNPPYRYHESLSGHQVGGWLLPKDWCFDSERLQKWLLERPNYLRIKGVMQTQEGWLAFNISPENLSIYDSVAQEINKLELIFIDTDSLTDANWQDWDDELLELILNKKPSI